MALGLRGTGDSISGQCARWHIEEVFFPEAVHHRQAKVVGFGGVEFPPEIEIFANETFRNER